MNEFQDYQGGFVIDDIEETASMPEQTERVDIKVPAGWGYNVRIKPVNFAKAKMTDTGFMRVGMRLEVIDGPYAGGIIWVNIWHNNGSSAEGKKRDGMSKREIAKIAQAVGVVGRLDNIGDQLGGKNLTCDYLKSDKSDYVNAKNFRPLGSLKNEPAPKPKPQTEGPTEPSDEIPF